MSPESAERDHGEKFVEYEKGGVPEYWIMDYLHREGHLYRLNAEGIYDASQKTLRATTAPPTCPDWR